MSWLVTAFLLSASIATPIVGKLGDVYGKGRVLTAVLLVFSAGAVVAALGTSVGVVIAGRVLQGVAGGVFPLAFGIVRDTFPRERVPAGLGMVSAIFGVGGGIGLPLSGVVVDVLDTGWLFWVNLVSLPAAFAAHRLLPPMPTTAHPRIDWPGAAVLSVALGAILLGVSEADAWGWGSPANVGLIAGGLLVAGAFVVARGPRGRPADRPRRAPPPGRRGDEPHRVHGRRRDVLELPAHPAVRPGAGRGRLRLRRVRHGRGPAAAPGGGRPAR